MTIETTAAAGGLRQSLTRWSARARRTELLKVLVVPGSLALVGGFVVMFLGWYGASRSYPEVAQIPYIISGGLFGLALVVVGALLLTAAIWISQLERIQRGADERLTGRIDALEARLMEPPANDSRPRQAATEGSGGRRRRTTAPSR